MYEIWLALNIIWEIALTLWPGLLVAFLVWLGLLKHAFGRNVLWGRGVSRAAGIGIVVAIVSFLAVPMLTRSSLSALNYWVDWANLAAIAIAFGVAAGVFLLPLLSPSRRLGL